MEYLLHEILAYTYIQWYNLFIYHSDLSKLASVIVGFLGSRIFWLPTAPVIANFFDSPMN